MSDWAIPQQAKLKYTQLFNLHDRSRSGFLSGLQCRDILMQSGLPRTILAEIWNLSDIDGDGQLTREEFILAMHLTNQARAGQTLPQELSPDLIPPSYRRTRSISTTSVHSTTSSVGSSDPTPPSAATATATSSNSNTMDDQLSQKSTDTMITSAGGLAGSILNSNSFEDKRRENFEKGRAELERRRLKIIEQQTSIISEQLVKCKKQVAEAKSKIDSMRSERDTKAGLITSLEAQLKTVRERKAFLDHEEMQIIAIARDLNLVKSPHSAELDQQATIAKQASINQLKEQLADVEKQRDVAVEKLDQAKARLEESMKELKSVNGEVNKNYETYKEKIANAKVLRQQFIEETKSKPIDLDSIWGSNPTQTATNDTSFKADPVSTLTSSDDPWSTTNAFPEPKQPFDDAFAFAGAMSTSQTATASNNNNDTGFEPPRDYNNSFPPISPEQQSAIKASNNFNEPIAPVSMQKKKLYKVLYEFEARNPDELTINPGDIIVGSEVTCEPGWLSGETNGRSGLFPEAYVEPMANDERPTSDHVVEPSLSTITDLPKSQPTPGLSSQELQPKASPSKPTIVKYKVIYAFEARNPDELTINPGDIITGLDLPHEPGWLMGELNSQQGLFPEAYVERLAEAQVNPDGQIGTLRRGSSSGSLRSKKSRAKKAEVATVIANYRALGQEQLNLEKGQLVLIRRKMDSGWWEGELQIKGGREGNELDHLIGELVDSELDYVNDLQLCQNAYIRPLSASFDLSHIFTNWRQLIERHESALKSVYIESCRIDDSEETGRVGYEFILETFQSLLNSVVDLYVDFCSRQLDATRQLEAKIASDIRFRQLVNESQRKLKRLIEDGQKTGEPTKGQNNQPVDQNIERAQRNSNLPMTTFLLKPMQRITKYELLFDRMLKSLVRARHKAGPTMQTQLNELKRSAKILCRQVNEACRLKEDDQDNSRRLRWCQSHILQHSYQSIEQPQIRPYSIGGGSPLAGIAELRLSGDFMRSQSSSDSLVSHHNSNIPLEQIQFESNTNCMGPRRILKAGSMFKLSSSKELVVYLFNDLLLITQVKGGVSLQVQDVFKSDRARQAYYKLYRRPVLLEELELSSFTSDQLGHQMPLLCNSIAIQPVKDQSDLVVSLLDRKSGSVHNLVASSQAQKTQWVEVLAASINEARQARELHLGPSLIQAAKRLNIKDCFGRLLVTVLELVKITTPKCNPMIDEASPRLSSLEQPELVQNLSIRLQLRLYKKAPSILDDSEQREIIAISDEFRTKTLVVCGATRQPTMVDMSHEISMSVLDAQRDVYKFSEADSTQFLLASGAASCPNDGMEYLDVELVDDSLYRETRQLGRKRISLDQLLGRDKSGGGGSGNHLSRSGSSASSRRAASIRSDRGVQPLQADRPADMTLKLKTLAVTGNANLNGQTTRVARSASNGTTSGRKYESTATKYNVKLRLHLQLFNCDTTNSLI